MRTPHVRFSTCTAVRRADRYQPGRVALQLHVDLTESEYRTLCAYCERYGLDVEQFLKACIDDVRWQLQPASDCG